MSKKKEQGLLLISCDTRVAPYRRNQGGRGNGLMGSKLPVLNGREVVRIFGTFGWQQVRQSASHMILTRQGEVVTLSVPDDKDVARGMDE